MTDVLVTIPAIPTNPLGEFGEELLLLLSPQLLSMENEINKEDEVRENIFKTVRNNLFG